MGLELLLAADAPEDLARARLFDLYSSLLLALMVTPTPLSVRDYSTAATASA